VAHGEAAIVAKTGADSPFLLLGDHAGRDMPSRLGDLGLSEPDLSRHIAWDIGVAGLGAMLSDRLGACFIAQRWSRLVIDCNRDPGRADSIVTESDGSAIPGNADLSDEERARRVAEVFTPYHAAIAAELDARAAAGLATVVVALHSFTPVMRAFQRPGQDAVLAERHRVAVAVGRPVANGDDRHWFRLQSIPRAGPRGLGPPTRRRRGLR
jgi:predicted N-formylglutamate amidohydrolase